MVSFNELLERVKSEIQQTTPESVHERLEAGEALTLLDVREREEFVDGSIEGSYFISRGMLDQNIETMVPDRSTKIVLFCAAGSRSAFAARSLNELGYKHVESMTGGFTAWKRAGYSVYMPKTLTHEQMTRFSRQIVIPEVGETGQQKLLEARVLLLGAGALGSPTALYLTAAGVGKIGLIDNDVVDRSNLQRQVLHTDARVGTSKVDSARATLEALNPNVEIVTYNTWLSSENVLEIFKDWDIIVDGGDNFATRYLINDACVHLGIPNIHGSIYRFEGQATSFVPRIGPCYRCLYPEPPPPELAPNCQQAGVLGVVPGLIGMLQATEAIKLILDEGKSLAGRLITYDALNTEFRELKLRRDPECSVCGDGAKFTGFIDYQSFCNAN